MRSIAINIISSAKVFAPVKIENLDEKRLVPNMMMRRRLTRNAKVLLYLSDKCGFDSGKVVYGTCFSELEETAKIANAVLDGGLLSPTSFQNSVYNTAPSYFSLIHKGTDEILTVSAGMKTSREAIKTAALQALISGERVLCVCVECINIKNIEEINRCANYLEAGAAFVLEANEDMSGAKEIEDTRVEGMMDSLKEIMSVVDMHEHLNDKIIVEL